MIDVVIPYYLVNAGIELRYALRSLSAHVSGINNLVIVGELPKFIDREKVIHIEAHDRDRMASKEGNIYRKLALACFDNLVTEDFLFMNDDHFILSKYEADKFPAYFSGILHSMVGITANLPYKTTLQNTSALVGRWARFFDCHCPMLMNSKKLISTVGYVDWSKPYGYALKSLYGWMTGIENEEYIEDFKIKHPEPYTKILNDLKGRPWFSTDDKAMGKDMIAVLYRLFPERSIWEL